MNKNEDEQSRFPSTKAYSGLLRDNQNIFTEKLVNISARVKHVENDKGNKYMNQTEVVIEDQKNRAFI